MRYIACALMFVSGLLIAAPPPVRLDPVEFEQRFHKADKGKKGKLTRAEAYAEFPRMPEFFDEIDTNRDGFITLQEVKKAMDRRVDAAINASNPARRYGSVEIGKVDTAAAPAAAASAEAAKPPQFSSSAEARRYYRSEYYENLAGSTAKARESGAPVADLPAAPILKKSF